MTKKIILLPLFFLTLTYASAESYDDTSPALRPTLNDKSILNEDSNHSVSESKILMYNSLYLTGYERDEVEEFRKLFKRPTYNALLRDSLEEAMELRLYVRKALVNAGLPPELEYLPVVESYYKTKAKSRSGALGLWQFMANSVKPFLELNDFVDERLDPWKETEAAIQKLSDNYRMFHDWLLAIAAYNCGAGTMQRALNKAEVKNFWYLCEKELLPKQTRDYVPKLLAIADLTINSEYYQMDIPFHQEEYETLYNEANGIFDYVTVNKPYSIKQLAREMRLDTDTMLYLNPSFIEGYTHPTKESVIRLPKGTLESAQAALEKIEPLEIPFKYKVVKGDTLWGISRKYKVSVKSICELNNIKENAVLSIGKILYIPPK
jgi:membrane-bound lytic murein transglycosylase D